MGYNDKERIQVKLEFLRMIARLQLDVAREHLAVGIFETYMILSPVEDEILKLEINKLDPKEAKQVIEIETSAEKRGITKGKIEGKIETAKDFICKYLQAQFGDASKSLQNQVGQLIELETLEQMIDKLFQVKKLSEAESLIEVDL